MIQTVLECCKNYDSIMNYHYDYSDYVSEKLIRSYQEYIFEVDGQDEKMLHMASQLDQIMNVYICNKSFYKYVQEYFLREEAIIFGDIIDLIALYHDYVKNEIKASVTTKWI